MLEKFGTKRNLYFIFSNPSSTPIKKTFPSHYTREPY